MTVRLSDKTFKKFMADNEKAVVDYYTTWCGPCKTMAPVVEKVAAELKGVGFAKVNIEEEEAEALAERAKVNAVPTFIAYLNGKEVARQEGGLAPREFRKWVEAAFEE